MGNSGEIKWLEPEYQGRLGQRHSFCYVKFGSSRFNSETGELKQLEPGYPRRPGDPGAPIAPFSAGSATPPPSMNLASSVTGEIKQLEPEYPRRPGDPGSRIAPSSAGSATPPPSMNLASSKAGEIKLLQPEYSRWPVQCDRFYYLRFDNCSFNSNTVELKQLEPEYPRRPSDPVPDCTIGDSPIAPSSAGSATPPSSMYLASSKTGETKQLEPVYPQRPVQRDRFYYLRFDSCSFNSNTVECPRRPGEPVPDCTTGDSPFAPSSAGSATRTSSMNLASSVTGKIKQLEPEYPRRAGEPVPDCMIGNSPFAPSSAGSATPPSSISVANSETGEIKQLEPEYPRRPSELDYTIGDSPIAFFSAGSAPPTSLMNLASSVSGEIKQLEPEYPRRPGKPDCPMSDASSLSPVSITTPQSENKRRIKKKSIVAPTGDPSSDVSATPPANSETGEKQPEPEYPLRPGKSDCSYYVKFGSCRYGMKCRFNSETGEIKQLEPEYPRRPGEPDCPMGDSPIAPCSDGFATPPSLTNLVNSETGEIKQLEPRNPRRPGEPNCTMGDSPIAPSSDGSATPPSSMNLANSETCEITQLEPEYPRRPGEPDCPMGDSSSFSSVSITIPPSGKKRGIKKKSITAPMGDPSSDGSAAPAPPANSETGEKQPEPEYPLRPGKRDCSYYVKFGSCRYGMNCWFNHPLYRPGDNGGGRNSSSGGSRASNSSEHKQYFSGKACNYNRHEGKAKVKQVKLNFLGLPLRPGTVLCSYYMDRGTCKFGTNCKFHHPDPESEHAESNASRHATQGSSQMNLSTKPVPRALNGESVPLVTSPTSGMLEIIPTQGANPSAEWSGYQMDENKQGKPDWDPFTTKVFCDICTDEVLAGNRPTDHLNAIGYNNLCAKFNEKTKKGYNHEQFESKWESLKKDYQTWKALTESEDDLGPDPKMNTISASLEWRAKKMEVMPDYGKFCFAPLENVNLLNIMFEDMLDSSSTAPEANLVVNTTIESEQGAGDGNDMGIIDKYVSEQSKEAMLPKSSNKEPNSTKLKTNYVHAELNDLVNFDENVNPSNLATSMRIDRVGSNISEIMELVVDAGAEEGSDEHFIATQLFIRPEHREMFLTLKTPRGRLGWLKKMCQVKELL